MNPTVPESEIVPEARNLQDGFSVMNPTVPESEIVPEARNLQDGFSVDSRFSYPMELLLSLKDHCTELPAGLLSAIRSTNNIELLRSILGAGPVTSADSGILGARPGPQINADSGILGARPGINADSNRQHPTAPSTSSVSQQPYCRPTDYPYESTSEGGGKSYSDVDSGILGAGAGPRINADSGILGSRPGINADSNRQHPTAPSTSSVSQQPYRRPTDYPYESTSEGGGKSYSDVDSFNTVFWENIWREMQQMVAEILDEGEQETVAEEDLLPRSASR